MKPKTMILMVVAVVCGLGASYMTSRLLAEREDQKQAPPEVIVQQVPKVNVLVLAADTQDGGVDGARAIPASVVTLALTPDDTQRVSLASEHGTLRLVLRDRLDDAKESDKVMTLDEVIKGGEGQQGAIQVA